jgi:hypothetical protein
MYESLPKQLITFLAPLAPFSRVFLYLISLLFITFGFDLS